MGEFVGGWVGRGWVGLFACSISFWFVSETKGTPPLDSAPDFLHVLRDAALWGGGSAGDDRNWTPALRAALNYDPAAAQRCDNGIFWIDWASVRRYFKHGHLNWNPALFQHRALLHAHWPQSEGPASDTFNYG